jgi:hypothetical protein
MKKLLLLCGLVLLTSLGSIASGGVAREVTAASPDGPFPRNKQNEPAIAMDASRPNVLAAGSNDEIDNGPCGTVEATPDSPCPFTTGVGGSGVYFSFDQGKHWTQPTYQGLTARNGTRHVGPIGTLPWYAEEGLVSDGDPAVAFGPKPDAQGHFSWANGSRLYYANLTSNIPEAGEHRGDSEDPPGEPDEPGNERSAGDQGDAFAGFEAIAVSRIDNVTPARIQAQSNWKRPVIASKQTDETFSDKEQVWADNAASSPFFGNVYVCYVGFLTDTAPLLVATSRNGGDTWSNKVVYPGVISGEHFGASGCTVRTMSTGVVKVFFEEFQDPDEVGFPPHAVHFVVSSRDGGKTWTSPRAIQTIVDNCFFVDPILGRCVMDGVAGSRDDLSGSPSVSIANGAPTGQGATNLIVNNWVDSNAGFNHERSRLSWSANGGQTWSTPVTVSPSAHRALYTAAGVSPNGRSVYVTYNAFLSPYQYGTDQSRPLVGVVRHASVATSGLSPWTTVHRSPTGDARASSQNDLQGGFLGDYVYTVASNDYAVGVWNDVRDGAHCTAVDLWRLRLRTGPPPATPQPQNVCPQRYGNTDIFSFTTAK